MKKFTAILVTVFIFIALFPLTAFAAAPEFDQSSVKADAYILVDAQSGQVLVEHNPDQKVYPASTTKLMMALLVLEKGDLSKKLTAGEEINRFGSASSLVHLKENEQVNMKDLLYATMLVSGNDGAVVLAKGVSGSEDKFVQLMNDKAKELKMDHTNFVHPEGTHDPEHYTTANDMKALMLYALKNQAFRDLIFAKTFELPKTNKHDAVMEYTTNKLISTKEEDKEYNYQYAEGGKTGLTVPNGKDNGCLVAVAKKDNTELIALIFGDHSSSGKNRWPIAKALFEYGFNNYQTIDLKNVLTELNVQQQIGNASENDENDGMMTFGPTLEDSLYYTGTADQISEITTNKGSIIVDPQFESDDIQAPIKKGQKYGTITYKSGDQILYQGDLYALSDMAAQGQATMATPGPSPTGAVKTLPPAKLPTETQISPWWWMLLPVILIAVITIRVVTLNRKRRSKFRNKRKVYNYRIR